MRLQGIFDHPNVALYAKLEWHQFGQRVKARAAYSIIADAIGTGRLDAHKVLLDATSGNTGIAYAAIGLRVRLVPPGIRDTSAGIASAGVVGSDVPGRDAKDGAWIIQRHTRPQSAP